MPFSRWVALVHFVSFDVIVWSPSAPHIGMLYMFRIFFFCSIDSVSFSCSESFARRVSLMCFFSSFVLKKV